MRIVKCQQGTAEWLDARHGLITASRLVDVMNYNQPSLAQAKEAGFKTAGEALAAGILGKESAARESYRTSLVAERLTGRTEEHFVSNEMMWGTEQEVYARAAYEMAEDVLLDRVGFVLHPTQDFSGASPDALRGKDGSVEFKCPKTTTHLRWMRAGVVPEEHQPQMQWVMACCEREWCDFMSFDPRLPPGLRCFMRRLMRDELVIARMEAEVQKLEDEIQAELCDLTGRIIEQPKPEPEDFGDMGITDEDIAFAREFLEDSNAKSQA